MEDLNFSKATIISFSSILLLFALFHLYLISTLGKKYTNLAKSNKLLVYDIMPNRGIIFDDKNQPLTFNNPTFILEINSKDTLNNLIEKYPEIKKLYNKLSAEEQATFPLTLYNVNDKLTAQILNEPEFKSLVKLSTVRSYKYPYTFAHTIGYTSKVFKEDLDKNPKLYFNDIIGRSGLEKYYDDKLRGQHGKKVVEVDALGNIIAENLEKSTPAVNGANIKTNINTKMQRDLYNSIAYVTEKYHIKGGAGVIIEVNTGAVKAIVSYPSYNINDFAKGIDAKTYNKLLKDPRLPLFNRATMAQAPPGSTFKTMVAISALQENAITEYTKFYSSGTITLAGGTPFQEYHKHVYGWLTVRDALMVSSNIFFCKTILKLGIDKLDAYLEKFGIGQETGIDLPSEAKGRIPSIEEKIKLAKNGAYWLDPIWYPEGDSCNSAIGQGITLVTPVQLANVAATIANNGTVYQPQIADKIQYPNYTEDIKPKVKDHVPASQHVFDIVKQGMYLSVHGSRAIIRNLAGTPVTVAAKTGTAEFGVKTKDGYVNTHAWVMGFYPYEKPKYAFAVFLEAGGSSLHASEVMQVFLDKQYK